MKNFLRIASGINVMPLLLAITRKAMWKEDTYLRGYPQGPEGDVESIILRFPDVARKEEEGFDQHENIDCQPYLVLPEARPLVMGLMTQVGGERLGRVIINKIKPGGRIFPHADEKPHSEYYERFHIVLQSTPGVDFRAEDEHVYMDVGSVWWFNNAVEHEVVNNSATDRIHLIVDIRTSAK